MGRKGIEKAVPFKKDYLKAQLYDTIETFGEPFRMTEGPAGIRKALNGQIDLFIWETGVLLSNEVQRGLHRGDSAKVPIESLCRIFEEKAKHLNGHVRHRYIQAGWYRLLQQAAPEGVLFQILYGGRAGQL